MVASSLKNQSSLKKPKKTRAEQSTLQVFLLCSNRNDSQTFKRSSCKNVFSSAYVIDVNCFDECILFQVISGRHYFFEKSLSVLWDFFNCRIVVFFETSVLNEVRILNYLRKKQSSAITKVPKYSYIHLYFMNFGS